VTDLLDLIWEADHDQPPQTLFASATRGFAARIAEFDTWRTWYGRQGCLRRSHGWNPGITHPDTPAGRCQPTLLDVDLRCTISDHWRSRSDNRDPCLCTGHLLYRGACRHCDWEGEPRLDENQAVEDAHDHAWPGWRDLPVMPHHPYEKKPLANWMQRVLAAYPDGWVQAGGPILTWREQGGTRHHWAMEWGSYDMGVPAPGDEQ